MYSLIPKSKTEQTVELDGWKISIRWDRMYYSSSFFVPSVNWPHDRKQILAAAAKHEVPIKIKGVVEDGVRGLRVWRS